eukprot:m.13833 g.13833  ORF g.13833 m.13833 type:complete len:132 (-) comp10227_c0_seq2:256-651(-)
MAGWQDHADALCRTGNVTRAAIYGINGAKWAATDGFQAATADEVKAILYAISNAAAGALMAENGIDFAGVHYTFLRRDEGHSIIGRKGQSGICFCKSTKAVVIGGYDGPISAPACLNQIEKEVDYLISMQM